MAFTYLFLGASTTCANRFWVPHPEGLGDGFVSMLAPKLRTLSPETAIINRGHDGFTVPFLRNRLSSVLPEQTPDHITLLIGVNDVGVAMNTGVSLEKQGFAHSYDLLLTELTKRTHARILCAGPFLFPHPQEYLNWIPLVRAVEHTEQMLAQKHGFPFLPLHDRMNEIAQKEGYEKITIDGIHLTARGHQALTDILFPFYKEPSLSTEKPEYSDPAQ